MSDIIWGDLKSISPSGLLTKVQSFLLRFPEHQSQFGYFLFEYTHNKSMLTNFQKFLSKNNLKKSLNLNSSKKWGKFKVSKNNNIFEILVFKNIKNNEQF